MARLFTSGFEVVGPGSTLTAFAAEDPALTRLGTGGTTSVVTTPVRSGNNAMKITNSSATDEKWQWAVTSVQTRTYFLRSCFFINNFGNSNTWPLNWFGSTGGTGVEVMVTPAGVLTAAHASDDTQVVLGPTITTGQWYVVEVSYNSSTGATQLWVNGTSFGTGTCETVGNTNTVFAWGAVTTSTATTWFYDDMAVNDDQGTSQNSRCGLGKVVLLKPASDNATTGFAAGAGATTSLFDAVNNSPPTGVAQASATNTSQIKDATSNTTDNYQPTLAAYTTALTSGGGGLGSSDTVVLAQGICNHGNSSATSRTNGIQVVSNPTIAETTGTTGTTTAGTFPTGWTCLKTVPTYSPSPTLGAGPVMEFRKATASTDFSMVDSMGLYVEYLPGSGGGGVTPAPVSRLMAMGVG